MPGKIGLGRDEQKLLVSLLSGQAANAPFAIGAKGYMEQLIDGTNWRTDWQNTRVQALTGIAKFDAQELVRWALEQGTVEDNERYTVLGSLLEVLIDDVSLENARKVATLIVARGLYRDSDLEARLRMRYQIPLLAHELADAERAGLGFGPEIDWCGPDDIELQSKIIELKKRAAKFKMEFLIQATQRASSVCKVEVDLENQEGNPIRRFGTGVLVAPRLILTNYHVLKEEDHEDIEENAHNTVLRFGDYKADEGNEKDGQTFELDLADDGSLILEGSPEKDLDFVLLQVESKIEDAEIEPVPIADPSYVPGKKSALHLVHHPGGEEMTVDFSPNGVASVISDTGKIQYFTWAMQGSSGAPCFDDDWRLVAIHHAEVNTTWGLRREGILFAPIHDKIKHLLGV